MSMTDLWGDRCCGVCEQPEALQGTAGVIRAEQRSNISPGLVFGGQVKWIRVFLTWGLWSPRECSPFFSRCATIEPFCCARIGFNLP